MLSLAVFEARFVALRPDLVAHARTYVQDTDLAQDLAQECYLAARDALLSYRGRTPSSLKAWLLGILNNLCKHAHQERRRQEARQRRLWQHLETDAARPAFAEQRDLALQLLRYADITPSQCWAIRLRIDGFRLREIGQQMGISPATVAEHVRAGTQRLQACESASAFEGAPTRKTGQRVSIYHAPLTTGSQLSREQLRRLK